MTSLALEYMSIIISLDNIVIYFSYNGINPFLTWDISDNF